MINIWIRRFSAWRAAVWLRRATRALATHDWWRNRAGEP